MAAIVPASEGKVPAAPLSGASNFARGFVESLKGGSGMLRLVLIETTVLVALLFAVLVFYPLSEPTQEYFAVKPASTDQVKMAALDAPNLIQESMLAWTATAVTEVMTFGFHDYIDKLLNAKRRFTSKGWDSFVKAWDEAGYEKKLAQNQLIVTAVPVGAPVITEQRIVRGQTQWVVQVPLLLTFQTGSTTSPMSSIVTLILVRVPTLEKSDGIGIEQWQMSKTS